MDHVISLLSLGLWDHVAVCVCVSVYPPYRSWAMAR
jgi:hypothetical protein